MLQGIVLFLFVGISMLLAAVAVGLSAVFLAVLSHFEQVQRRQARPRSDFLNKLQRRLGRKTFRGIGAVHQSYRAFFGVGVLRSSHLEDIAEVLQRAMHRIASEPQKSRGGKLQEKIQLLRGLLAANQRALDVERMCVPFSGTPEPERRILEEILELPVEDKTTVTAKLDALAKAIRFRQDTVEWLDQGSRRSVKLARWGWYGTLTLAILSAILGLISLGL
ncbi:MAG: hypothetical protein A2Z31_05195 [candidate division NC10 bacterium RBG_16_65_8]|nr:MAG: hypothetical protein A2Z31_05195 [candidate division NC10 bacterium RBG_16_65_8]